MYLYFDDIRSFDCGRTQLVAPQSGPCWKVSAMLGAVKLSISRDGIACGLVQERSVKAAEADVPLCLHSSHGENGHGGFAQILI